jgi:hypothetical protein
MRQAPNPAASGPNGSLQILPLWWKQNVSRVRSVARLGLLDRSNQGDSRNLRRSDTPRAMGPTRAKVTIQVFRR